MFGCQVMNQSVEIDQLDRKLDFLRFRHYAFLRHLRPRRIDTLHANHLIRPFLPRIVWPLGLRHVNVLVHDFCCNPSTFQG